MRGQLSIGGYYGNILRCTVYFPTATYRCSCNLFIANSF